MLLDAVRFEQMFLCSKLLNHLCLQRKHSLFYQLHLYTLLLKYPPMFHYHFDTASYNHSEHLQLLLNYFLAHHKFYLLYSHLNLMKVHIVHRKFVLYQPVYYQVLFLYLYRYYLSTIHQMNTRYLHILLFPDIHSHLEQ